MAEITYSPLSVFKITPKVDSERMFEVCDPVNNITRKLPPDSLSEVNDIKSFLDGVKNSIAAYDSKFSETNKLHHHWLNRGWYKSLDYYTASRMMNIDVKIPRLKKEPLSPEIIESVGKYNPIQALLRRRTKRTFQQKALENSIFLDGLKNAGMLVKNDFLSGFDIYFVIYNVEGFFPGVYAHDISSNTLSIIREGSFHNEMSGWLQGMRAPKMASFTIILVADFEKLLTAMPHRRGLRNTYIEVGKLAQKILVSYGQYDVSCLPTPALSDRAVTGLLKLAEPDFAPLYSLTFGYAIK